MNNNRFVDFSDAELAALAYAIRQMPTPDLGIVPREIEAERLSRNRLSDYLAWCDKAESDAYEAGIFG